jgi:hypothetical protein
MRFKGPAADLEEFCIPPEPFYNIFPNVPVSAEDLHGTVSDLFTNGRGDELDPVRVETISCCVKSQHPGGIVYVRPGRLILSVAFGDVTLNLSE